MEKILRAQTTLRTRKDIMNYNTEELRQMTTPMGLAHFESTYESDRYYDDISSISFSNSDDSEVGESTINESTINESTINESTINESVDNTYSEYDPESDSSEPELIFKDNSKKKIKIKTLPKDESEKHKLKTQLIEKELDELTRKKRWTDRVKCQVCGKEYSRSNGSAHRGTKIHKVYEKANRRLLKLLRGK